MRYILSASGNKDTCLLAPLDIIHGVAPKYSWNQIEVEGLLDGLVQEDYINLVNSDKNGELIYCISINAKGKSFIREQHNIKKNWLSVILKAVITAVITFIVGLILKAIFL
jgi:hypothetical protein